MVKSVSFQRNNFHFGNFVVPKAMKMGYCTNFYIMPVGFPKNIDKLSGNRSVGKANSTFLSWQKTYCTKRIETVIRRIKNIFFPDQRNEREGK